MYLEDINRVIVRHTKRGVEGRSAANGAAGQCRWRSGAELESYEAAALNRGAPVASALLSTLCGGSQQKRCSTLSAVVPRFVGNPEMNSAAVPTAEPKHGCRGIPSRPSCAAGGELTVDGGFLSTPVAPRFPCRSRLLSGATSRWFFRSLILVPTVVLSFQRR